MAAWLVGGFHPPKLSDRALWSEKSALRQRPTRWTFWNLIGSRTHTTEEGVGPNLCLSPRQLTELINCLWFGCTNKIGVVVNGSRNLFESLNPPCAPAESFAVDVVATISCETIGWIVGGDCSRCRYRLRMPFMCSCSKYTVTPKAGSRLPSGRRRLLADG